MAAHLPRYEGVVADERLDGSLHVVRGAAAVNAIAANDIGRTRDCKAGDCTNEAPARGRYAGLCNEHRPGGSSALAPAAPRPVLALAPTGVATTPTGVPVSLKAAAQKLVPVAGRLDAALAKKRSAHADAREVFAEFKQAFEQIQAAAREALG